VFWVLAFVFLRKSLETSQNFLFFLLTVKPLYTL
jgi:hypothetical protein